MASEWYYLKERVQHGPVPSSELQRLAASGELKPDDYIWKEGLEDWIPAGQSPKLFPMVAGKAAIAEPTPPAQIISGSDVDGPPGEDANGKRIAIIALIALLLISGLIAGSLALNRARNRSLRARESSANSTPKEQQSPDRSIFLVDKPAQQALAPANVVAPDANPVAGPAAQPVAQTPQAPGTIRIKAGVTDDLTDSTGKVWEKESGFDGGDVADRGSDLVIENTKTPELYRTEHWGMNSFMRQAPNGPYTITLYFAETYSGITDAGQRIFSVKCGDQEIDNIDIFKETGGQNRPLTKVLKTNVTDGNLVIQFIRTGQNNPEINAIEITPG